MVSDHSGGPGEGPCPPISLGAQLVVSVLGDVADPGQRLVPGLLDDLQVPDLQQQSIITKELCDFKPGPYQFCCSLLI